MGEIIVEIILQLLLEIGGDLFVFLLARAGKIPWINKIGSNFLTALVLFAIGAFMGWVSLWFFPKAFVRSENFHGISLFVTPVLAGATMAAIGSARERWGKPVIQLGNFWFGYVVAFGIALVRFYLTE